ncbi:MAG: alcohol dehydrogenase catalytic domain-containing protein [Pseudomonadota bacterium]
MKAAVLTAFRAPLEIQERPDPECPEDGVVLEVAACGVCRSDWHGWVGAHPLVKPGHVPGHEYCGTVVESGKNANWAVGERVIAPFILACGACPDCHAGQQTVCANQRLPGFTQEGAFATFVAVPFAHNLTRLPDAISPALAAGLGCRVTTAWHALTGRAALQPGEWLAVHGTGGVGMAAVILGRALGARVIAVDIVAEKLTLAHKIGAEAVVDASVEDVAAAIKDITQGGAHVSVEALGIAATTNASLRCLRPLGRHVQLGYPAGEHASMTLDIKAIYAGSLAVYGSRGMPSWRYPSLLGLIERGDVDLSPMIGSEIALSGASAALAAMDHAAAPGVTVITDFKEAC